MENKIRRYDIDWLRVIAIAILLVFHIMVMYRPYAKQIQFIQSPILLEILSIPLSLFSVLRIPLLFFVSGMGVFFSLQSRNWKQLLVERTKRILIPLLFGSIAIVPVHQYLYAKYYTEKFTYFPDAGHLWFLINICMYVLWFLALFYFAKEFQQSRFLEFLRKVIVIFPVSVYLLAIPYILQALTIPADVPYTLFYDSRVGLLLGAIAFLIGFTFVALGKEVWEAISRIKYYTLIFAFLMFINRIIVFEHQSPHILTSVESISWIFGIFGLGYTFLNKPSKILTYLSQAAYPVYILHMIFLYLGAYLIFPLNLNVWIGLIVIIAFTFFGCFISYELLKRIFFLKPLFGLKITK